MRKWEYYKEVTIEMYLCKLLPPEEEEQFVQMLRHNVVLQTLVYIHRKRKRELIRTITIATLPEVHEKWDKVEALIRQIRQQTYIPRVPKGNNISINSMLLYYIVAWMVIYFSIIAILALVAFDYPLFF